MQLLPGQVDPVEVCKALQMQLEGKCGEINGLKAENAGLQKEVAAKSHALARCKLAIAIISGLTLLSILATVASVLLMAHSQ